MIDDALGVFFDADDFAVHCTRQRPGEDDQPFSGLLSVTDEPLLDGTALLGQHQLQYASAAAALEADDIVLTQHRDAAGVLQPAQAWRVLRSPERAVDGAQSIVYLEPEEL